MNWLDAALLLVLLLGLGAGAFMVARSPAFYVALGREIGRVLIPSVVRIVTKRMPPEQEAAWRDCYRRGGKWNDRTKRCE